MKSTRELHNQMEQQDLKTRNTIEYLLPLGSIQRSLSIFLATMHNLLIPGTRPRFLAPIKKHFRLTGKLVKGRTANCVVMRAVIGAVGFVWVLTG